MSHKQKESWLSRLTTKGKIIIALVVVFVVAVIGVLVYSAIFSAQYIDSKGNTYSPQEIRKEFAAKNETDRQSDAASMAYEALRADDRKKADVIYEQAISAENNPTAKVELVIDQTSQLYYTGRYDEAIDAAKKAESYSSDKFLIYDCLGRLYYASKKYDDAAKYFLLAADLTSSPTNKVGYSKQYYQDRAATMKTLASQSK